MNKADLVKEMVKSTGISKVNTEKFLNSFMDVVKEALKNDEKITLVGFGTFSKQERKATTGVNPQTKEKIQIPAKNVAKLKFSDSVNDMLNKK